ncbi:conserved hypothetical protein [Francisella philomiragia subsp. philomiragia ATCC 25015]|nr:conserved hypothetical protein [Francisella philomiragia subsp. philomiragia ATCC 25015]MBK2237616.1 HAMP domain-containing histidine kinase [Francisella philomiragia]
MFFRNKKLLSIVVSLVLVLITLVNLIFIYVSYLYYSETQIYKPINIVTDLSYTFYNDLENKSIDLNKKTILSKSSANIEYTITKKPVYNLVIKINNPNSHHEARRKNIENSIENKKVIKNISVCYKGYETCFNLHIESKAKFYLYYISLCLSLIISIFFPIYIIYSQLLLINLMRFKRILFKITKNDIKEFYIFTPRNLKLIPKTIFKIIISLKKEIKNTRFTLNAISHDLKTPLTKAKLLIENRDTNNPMIISYFNDIEYLFSQITTYNRRDNNKEKLSKIDIVDFTECLYDDYNMLGYPITFFSSIEHGVVYIQNQAMRRAFVNIIENAFKYAGSVSISIIEYDKKVIQVSFVDNGPGISENDLKKVFTPFFRSNIARNSMVPGTGLGLSIVKKVLDINNAQIEVMNNEPEGLKVSIKFNKI